MPFLPKLGALLLTVTVAGSSFFACALLLHPELDALMAGVRRRLKR
jgi:hypothetical protein